MAKGRVVTDEVETLIGWVSDKHPKWTAQEVQTEVHLLLRDKDPAIDEGWPGLSKVQKILARIRQKRAEPDLQDKPWSLATLDQGYRMPNEAIPGVLKVWADRLRNGKTLSIREAKWAARLWGVKPEAEELSVLASQYARAERIYQSMGRPFISGVLDARLMGFNVRMSGTAGHEAMIPFWSTEEDVAEAERMRQEKPKMTKAEILAGAEATLQLMREAEAKGMVVDASLLVGDSGIPKRRRRGAR